MRTLDDSGVDISKYDIRKRGIHVLKPNLPGYIKCSYGKAC